MTAFLMGVLPNKSETLFQLISKTVSVHNATASATISKRIRHCYLWHVANIKNASGLTFAVPIPAK